MREKLEKFPQSDRDEFKQKAVVAVCQEDKERYERNDTYYAVDFKTRMVHRWSHEQVMRQGLHIIRDNPKALARFEMEKKEAVLKDGVSPEKAEASSLRERVSPASKDWMVGIDRGHPGFFFQQGPDGEHGSCIEGVSRHCPPGRNAHTSCRRRGCSKPRKSSCHRTREVTGLPGELGDSTFTGKSNGGWPKNHCSRTSKVANA